MLVIGLLTIAGAAEMRESQGAASTVEHYVLTALIGLRLMAAQLHR
jgi:hypothetical protein